MPHLGAHLQEECLPPTDTAGPSGDIDGLASLHLSYLLRPSSHYQAQVRW